MSNARKQLDADHYGLDKIKKRLIEYLAIVRLKELAAYAENEKALVLKTDAPLPVLPSTNRVKGPILLYVIRQTRQSTTLTSRIGSSVHQEPGRLRSRRLWLVRSVVPLNGYHSEAFATRQRFEGTAAPMSPVAPVRLCRPSREMDGRIRSSSCKT